MYARIRPVAPELAPERLYSYLDALWQRRALDGAVVEVGCFRGGTTRFAYGMLARTGYPKRYYCVDTFGGFVPTHFEHDVGHGAEPRARQSFSASSPAFFKHVMAYYDCKVDVVAGDIATVPDSLLPERIAVALIDVDLAIPVQEGLKRLYPRLVTGGIVLVDDVGNEPHVFPGARVGYERFVEDENLPDEREFGMGIVRRAAEHG